MKDDSMTDNTVEMKIIARIHTDFTTKFGVPRQSGLVDDLKATIVFEPEYRVPEAVRGMEGFSHIWLIWQFSQAVREDWSPTVRPPRLGGNTRIGVFATRSPFRPNEIGLSSVRLERVELTPNLGPVLHVAGADLMDNTPIFDIKPYLPYADSHPEATGGFTDPLAQKKLTVEISPELLEKVPQERQAGLLGVLAEDPRPRYQKDPERVYGLGFAGVDVRFTVAGDVLHVVEVCKQNVKDR
jgi:tRNA-Thr(GGU) m(6)t(6)A37 methyltransferase TsaA